VIEQDRSRARRAVATAWYGVAGDRMDPSRREALDGVLDRLVASYAEGKAIDNLESAAMPNRRAVIEAFHSLQHALFMGFFSTCPLTPATLRGALDARLAPCVDGMIEQIERAVSYADRARPPAERRGATRAEATAYQPPSFLTGSQSHLMLSLGRCFVLRASCFVLRASCFVLRSSREFSIR